MGFFGYSKRKFDLKKLSIYKGSTERYDTIWSQYGYNYFYLKFI